MVRYRRTQPTMSPAPAAKPAWDRRLDACSEAPSGKPGAIVAFGPRAYGSGIGHPAPVQTIRLWIDGEMGEFAMT
jgi:hypothetical protein